jgi:hypothetical protein
MLGTIAPLSDEGLRDAREHYATLLEARPKPHVLDDATIARLKRVNGESLEWCDVYDRQLARWQRERLTPAQRVEVVRLQGVQRDLRECSCIRAPSGQLRWAPIFDVMRNGEMLHG